jgi:ribitol-5-phosphate 2-dehydrogenase (NADP+) / D-ribitol-5-phosphate cytidylyltransferase
MKNVAVLLAGGSGHRMQTTEPKQFIRIAGRSILEHSIRAFSLNAGIDEIVVVGHADYLDRIRQIAAPYPKVRHIVPGGKERYHSSLAAISLYSSPLGPTANDEPATSGGPAAVNLLIHDAVRCLVSQRIITDTVEALKEHRAVEVAVPCTDTICEVDSNGCIVRIPDRSTLRNVQTPQGFRLETIREAYDTGLKDPNFVTTDDCGVVLRYLPDVPIHVVDGETTNIKITYPEDLVLAEKILSAVKDAGNAAD